MRPGVDYDNWSGPVDVNPDAPAGVETVADVSRLSHQRQAVWDCISDGKWWSLEGLETATGYPQASISARLRDFRKEKFGEHNIEREYMGGGLYHYRLNRGGGE